MIFLAISSFLLKNSRAPISWLRSPIDADEEQQANPPICQVVFSRLHQIALQRLIDAHLIRWRRGLEHKGNGPATHHAVDIRVAYEHAMPITVTVSSAPEIHLAVWWKVRAAVVKSGGVTKP